MRNFCYTSANLRKLPGKGLSGKGHFIQRKLSIPSFFRFFAFYLLDVFDQGVHGFSQQIELFDGQVVQLFQIVFDRVDDSFYRSLHWPHEIGGDGCDDGAEKKPRTNNNPDSTN